MEQTTKYALASYLVGVILTGTAVFKTQIRASKLERELTSLRAETQMVSHQRDYFRKLLIQNNNSEGWEIDGDGLGNFWYKKWSDFGTGGQMEYLR